MSNNQLCSKYGCNYELDLDGQITCSNCGAMGDDMPNPININNSAFETQVDFE